MTAENEKNEPTNPLQQIGAGLKSLFAGLMQQPSQASLPTPGDQGPTTATLRYEQETVTVKKSDHPEGLTIREAFEDNASTLGLDTSRDMAFRSGSSVVDGNASLAWGGTYTVQVARSTKG